MTRARPGASNIKLLYTFAGAMDLMMQDASVRRLSWPFGKHMKIVYVKGRITLVVELFSGKKVKLTQKDVIAEDWTFY